MPFITTQTPKSVYFSIVELKHRLIKSGIKIETEEEYRDFYKKCHEKSAAGSPTKLKFLGFCIGKDRHGTHVRIHPKSRERFENKIREITRRNKGVSIESIMGELRNYIIGWLHYYGLADMKSYASKLAGWIRRKLRAFVWKRWKSILTRSQNLVKLGCSKDKAWQWANTQKGIWRIAGSKVLEMTLTNKVLMKMGLLDIEATYARINNSFKH